MISAIQIAMDDFKDQTQSLRRQIQIVDFLCGQTGPPVAVSLSKTQLNNFKIIQKRCGPYTDIATRTSVANGAIVVISSMLEQFARLAVSGAVSHLKTRKKAFKDLNQSIQNAQMKEFADLLLRQMREGQLFSVHFINEVSNLHKCLNSDIGYSLMADSISRNRRNVTSIELAEMCGRIGLKKIMDNLASYTELQDYFGQYNIQIVSAKTAEKMNNFMAERNSITHGGSSAKSYATNWITDYLEFFDVLTISLASELDKYAT